MKVLVATLLFAAAFAMVDHTLRETRYVDNQYIVVFHETAAAHTREAHFAKLPNSVTVRKTFNIGSFHAYSAKIMSDEEAYGLQSMPEVNYVEQDQHVYVQDDCTIQNSATWGLVRSGQRDLNLNGMYNHNPESGDEVDVYILDTGIYCDHTDFEDRCTWGTNTIDNDDRDGHGHGTHVAGTVSGHQWGVAKHGHLIAVKVLGNSGGGTWESVIGGIDWAANQHASKPGARSVGNMSLGGNGVQQSVIDATNAAVRAGVTMSIAAGNSNANACNFTPAAAEDAITVASSDDSDRRSSFSNWGDCVEVFAPGSSVTSAWIGSPVADRTISGTSMAAPHIAGIAVDYLYNNPSATWEEVKAHVINTGTKDKISDPRGTPNVLGYIPCEN